MSIDISHETETRLTDEARRQGVSVDALLERLMIERGAAAHVVTGNGSSLKSGRSKKTISGSMVGVRREASNTTSSPMRMPAI